jgi:hypothetical protein
MMVLGLFNVWYEWSEYFIYHYEEYLKSDFFEDYVWKVVRNSYITVTVILAWFFFWPITLPLTLVLFNFIVLLIIVIIIFA